ncbi:hypothetical protein Phum_PHUM057720 [Pediculus humanus corporis]|uniref:Uncharacterized protein n=1 Tax=Pediculus humanus subsp. corporis TaxID=121224 RepID=E0VBC8_PEDHC|nr:uncharacterized protein Phum_PHUM057720 [Pediculus humanus corporis]EEB10684.1 hypothetical protein Phum_PHUM057720 [Pediculus humanus corporis]
MRNNALKLLIRQIFLKSTHFYKKFSRENFLNFRYNSLLSMVFIIFCNKASGAVRRDDG